jgi:hypothetical protein
MREGFSPNSAPHKKRNKDENGREGFSLSSAPGTFIP